MGFYSAMNRYVTIYSKNRTSDGQGGFATTSPEASTNVLHAKIPAFINGKKDAEYLAALSAQQVGTYTVIIDYFSDVKDGQILQEVNQNGTNIGQMWRIKFVKPAPQLHHLTLSCEYIGS